MQNLVAASFLDRNRGNFLKGKGTGGQVDSAGYALWALELGGWVDALPRGVHTRVGERGGAVTFAGPFPADQRVWLFEGGTHAAGMSPP